MTTANLIDFGRIEGPVYTGRDRGASLRRDLDLDTLDSNGSPVEVRIPTSTYTISSSFFLGLFGPSVVRAGTKEAFYRRFHFDSPEFLREVMDGYVLRALQSRNLFS
ncbi:hypothetical protein [Roseateles saccharophilus]|uniref:DUF4325 domain-containing protein n=1 Tax=Roseateles saccharophilus TaxID=304 RepID=A0A4R3UTZ4_ROSSA|nr:hypothetical protein [Roseateles saccharophilus]MBL8277951.1 hypothetical protein [Roseateles sp.]MDG0833114.1 hypothetical protein [Roseateles saccharophilus]TCU94582.1 hypothetical protein EV671_10164 [Roseateles saccharophilus]